MPTITNEITDIEIREGIEDLTASRIITLYRRAPLNHPVSDPEKVWQMFERASVVFSAWHEGRLVGIARVLSDGVLYSILCDLAVEPDVQGLGIGRRLADAVFERFQNTQIVLIGTGNRASAQRLYERYGFTRSNDVWIRRPEGGRR